MGLGLTANDTDGGHWRARGKRVGLLLIADRRRVRESCPPGRGYPWTSRPAACHCCWSGSDQRAGGRSL